MHQGSDSSASWGFDGLDMSYNLNSLKGGMYRGLYRGTTIRIIKGDTRSLDYSSYEFPEYAPGLLPGREP